MQHQAQCMKYLLILSPDELFVTKLPILVGKPSASVMKGNVFIIKFRKISYFNLFEHFVKKVKVWLTISPKQQHSSNWFSMKVWTLRILILNPIVSGMELQPMITMTSSAVENIQQGMSHIFEILLKPCFKNAISSSEQQQSLLWWFNN